MNIWLDADQAEAQCAAALRKQREIDAREAAIQRFILNERQRRNALIEWVLFSVFAAPAFIASMMAIAWAAGRLP
jgi:hypothetical protein